MRISSQPPLVHRICVCVCVCVCVYLFLVDQFILLTSFSLFVQYNLLWIYTFTTPYVMTLHVMITIMLVHGFIHDGQLRACQSCLSGLMYIFRVNVRSQVTVRYQVLRVSTCQCLYKKPNPSLFVLVFLEFLCQESFLHNQIGFLDVHGGYYTATIYIHYMFFLLCNSIHENFISTSSYALCIYMCVHLFLVDQFIPLIGFSLFV